MTRVLGLMLACGLTMGCELVVDFDRDQIPDGEDAAVDAGVDAPAVDAPANDAPMDDAPMDDAPAEDAPMMDAPMMDAPMEDAPMEDAPMSDAGVDAPADSGTDGGVECTMPAMCDDSIACTVDECTGFMCVNTPDDAMCDDSDDCTSHVCMAPGGCAETVLCGLSAGGSIMLADLTTIVTVPSVMAAEAGFVVVYDDAAGLGAVLGFASVPVGMSTNVDVELDRPVADAETLHVALHVDGDSNSMFAPAMDPIETLRAADVVETFTAVVPAGTPDLEVTVTGTGVDFDFDSSRPSTFTLPTGSDPAWALIRGMRYRIVNTTSGGHPWEFIDELTTPPTDDVLQLAQGGGAGALEAEPGIDWNDAAGSIAFTVDAAFEAGIDMYRCGIHTVDMRGMVTYVD